MQALILDDNYEAQAARASSMLAAGVQPLCVDSIAGAKTFVKVLPTDVLIISERVKGQLAHSVSLSGELHNPGIATIVLTDRPAPDVDELFDLLPSLVALLPKDASPDLVTQIAVSSVGVRKSAAPARVMPSLRPAATEPDVMLLTPDMRPAVAETALAM